MYRIPFNKPAVVGRELAYIEQAVQRGNLGGCGEFSARSVELIQELIPGSEVILTHSCTAALEIAGLVLRIGPGDEVILPSYTYVSTANAFVRLGARPVFVDILPDSLNLDPAKLEAAVSAKTRAIVAVHYGGVPGEIHAYRAVGERHGIPLLEDAAAALGSTFDGRPAGSFGHLACFSFHETKNLSCGQGGALVINRSEWTERARMICDRGTDRQALREGKVRMYTWQEPGSAFGLSELAAAYLCAQLEKRGEIQAMRGALCERYRERLAPLFESGCARPVVAPHQSVGNHHQFALILESTGTQMALKVALEKRGILGVSHYQPLHASPMGRKVGRCGGSLEVTERLASRLLRLPLFIGLGLDAVDEVTDCIYEFFDRDLSALQAKEVEA